MNYKSVIAAGLVAIGTVAGGLAWADGHSGDKSEIAAFRAAEISLTDALTLAEAQHGGKAMSVEFDEGDDGEASAWEVELISADGKVSEMKIDAATGAPVTGDHDDDDDGEDEDKG